MNRSCGDLLLVFVSQRVGKYVGGRAACNAMGLSVPLRRLEALAELG